MKEEDKNKANELIDRFIPEEECGINRSCAKVACVCMAEWKKNRMIEKAIKFFKQQSCCGFIENELEEFIDNFKKAMCDE